MSVEKFKKDVFIEIVKDYCSTITTKLYTNSITASLKCVRSDVNDSAKPHADKIHGSLYVFVLQYISHDFRVL